MRRMVQVPSLELLDAGRTAQVVGSLEVDSGVRFAHVEREPRRPDHWRLPAAQAGRRQVEQCGDRRERQARATTLSPSTVVEFVPIALRRVAHGPASGLLRHHLLGGDAAVEQCRREKSPGPRRQVPGAGDPASHVGDRGEDLAATGVDARQHRPAVPDGGRPDGEDLEAGRADDPDPPRLGQPLGRGHADAQTGEETRPDVDGHDAESRPAPGPAGRGDARAPG